MKSIKHEKKIIQIIGVTPFSYCMFYSECSRPRNFGPYGAYKSCFSHHHQSTPNSVLDLAVLPEDIHSLGIGGCVVGDNKIEKMKQRIFIIFTYVWFFFLKKKNTYFISLFSLHGFILIEMILIMWRFLF